jgi:hypothetical protein
LEEELICGDKSYWTTVISEDNGGNWNVVCTSRVSTRASWGHRQIAQEVAEPGPGADMKPQHTIKFGVIGLDHNHIMGMTAAVIRGGGQLAAFYTTLPKPLPISRRSILTHALQPAKMKS